DGRRSGRVPHRSRSRLRNIEIRELARAVSVVAVAIVVALAVDTAAQARLGEYALFDLPLLAQQELRLERVDLLSPSGVDPTVEERLPAHRSHLSAHLSVVLLTTLVVGSLRPC